MLREEQHDPPALQAEAAVLGRYLAGRAVDAECVARYVDGVARGFAPLEPRERRLLDLAVRLPWLLGCLDAAAALRDPRGGLRRRLLLMFAILETTPAYGELFLPAPRSRLHAFSVAWAGARAVARAFVGLALTGLLR